MSFSWSQTLGPWASHFNKIWSHDSMASNFPIFGSWLPLGPPFLPPIPLAHRIPAILVSFCSSNIESTILLQGLWPCHPLCLAQFLSDPWSDVISSKRLLLASGEMISSSLRLLGLSLGLWYHQTHSCLLLHCLLNFNLHPHHRHTEFMKTLVLLFIAYTAPRWGLALNK